MLFGVGNAQLICQPGLHGHVGVYAGGKWPAKPNPILCGKWIQLSSDHSNIYYLTGFSVILQMGIFFGVAFNEVQAIYSLHKFGNTQSRDNSLDKISEPEKCILQLHRGSPWLPPTLVNWAPLLCPGMHKCHWKTVHWKEHIIDKASRNWWIFHLINHLLLRFDPFPWAAAERSRFHSTHPAMCSPLK